MSRATIRGLFALASVVGCSSREPATQYAPLSPGAATAGVSPVHSATEPPPDPGCDSPGETVQITLSPGVTERTDLGVAVTFEGSEHDHYDDGRTELVARLRFQGVMDGGKLTPSAFSWRASALAPPRWSNLGSMPLCVRLFDGGSNRITLEIFRARRR